MAYLELPVVSDADSFRETVTLEGLDYGLRFHWNYRDERWYLDIYDAEAGLIKGSIPLVVDTPLLKYISDTRCPPGELLAVDTSGAHVEAGIRDLGDRVMLLYLESTDV